MTILRPQTTSNQLLEEIERLSNVNGPTDELALRRLDRAADRLIGTNAAQGYGAKAAIAALRRDTAATQRFASLAVQNAPSNYAVLVNAAVSLRLAGALEDGIDYLRRALVLSPSDTRMTRDLCRWLLEAGRLDEAEQFAQRAKKAGAQLQDSELQHLRDQAAMMARLRVKPEQLAREVVLTQNVLRAHGLRPLGLEYSEVQDPDTGAPCMVHVLGFKGEVGQAIEMENELAEALGEYDDWDPLRLNMQYRAVPDGIWHERYTE